ncbi:hypothetical protein SDC9_84477 [bioreactor metagenome]|uniref:Uncharacterized protein n=1 Tax=bioreactor metagenome TaxID=1076179 RepID=A0A644ZC51_9ZZZZ
MQEKSIFPNIVFQSRTSKVPVNVISIIFRDIESCFNSSVNSSKAYASCFQEIGNHSLIIPDRREWFSHRKTFKLNSFESFASNIPSSLNKRGRKFWIFFSNFFIGCVMDRHFTMSFMLKAVLSDFVKHSVKKSNSFLEDYFIFLRNTEFKFNRSIHIHILHLIHFVLNGGAKAGSLRHSSPKLKT